MTGNNLFLSRFFSKKTIHDLINDKQNSTYLSAVNDYLDYSDTRTNSAIIHDLYRVMDKVYRNEYFYKNTLMNKLLLGRHSLNTTTALSEIAVGKSKADIVLINGKAVVYEIKTELDTLDRLDTQIRDYYRAFTSVCVVTSESNYEKIDSLLYGTSVGVAVLTDRSTISIRKKPIEQLSELHHEIMFKILRKSEFENIILAHYGQLPTSSAVKYYKKCYNLFEGIEIMLAYRYFLRELKERQKIDVEKYKSSVPYELKSLCYFSNFTSGDYLKLEKFLNRRYGG